MKKPKSKHRHRFLYEIVIDPNDRHEKKKTAEAWSAVTGAKKPVVLTLTPEHVRKSIRAHGAGSTTRCAMAFCVRDHASLFSHSVADGELDFNYATAFVASKRGKSGLPILCVLYSHDLGHIARLNDTAGGQKKLLKLLEKNGPLTVTLMTPRKRSDKTRAGHSGGRDGSRTGINKDGVGARLRYAVMTSGGVPPASRPTLKVEAQAG